MTASPTETLDPEVIAAQERFVKHLPRIHKVLRFRLRGLPEERKEEVMAEAVAITWQNYINRVREGRDPEPLVQKMAEFAARHAYRGGHLAGRERINDVMTRQHGRSVQSLPLSDDEEVHPEVLDGMRDRREVSPADEAIARADFTDWVSGLTETQREIAEDMTSGLNTADVGRKRGVTRTRIWQHRQAMEEDHDKFEAGERGR